MKISIVKVLTYLVATLCHFQYGICRDEDRIVKEIACNGEGSLKERKKKLSTRVKPRAKVKYHIISCYWPNEMYEPCFGGCAEISCDNPRNHLRPCYPYCEPGCVCEEPYVRDDRTHQCVLPQDCTPTQMGIPVPSKRSTNKQSFPKYGGKMSRSYSKREDSPLEFNDNEVPPTNRVEELKRASEVSRMGNYFNIVIAPPPIKALQPRKLLQNDAFRPPSKRA